MKKTLTLSSIAVLITLFFMLRQPDAPQQHQPHELEAGRTDENQHKR